MDEQNIEKELEDLVAEKGIDLEALEEAHAEFMSHILIGINKLVGKLGSKAPMTLPSLLADEASRMISLAAVLHVPISTDAGVSVEEHAISQVKEAFANARSAVSKMQE